MSLARRLPALLLISLAFATRVSAATLFDPSLRFRTLPTQHFVIYFHQGESALAQRLAVIAEETWASLRQSFDDLPPPLTHVVLADQAELANGYATPLPRNIVVITAAWPAGSEFIGNIDDWLRMVFTHEFTHIVHLDRSKGWARVVRSILGRSAFAFPNVYLPTWQVEGLATYEESALTGAGRLHAGDFTAVIGEEARQGRMQPLDRVNGGLTDWPGGLAPYAYGLGFHQYLADRFGGASLGRLADATSRRVPYFTKGAFSSVFGESLNALWTDYTATARDAAGSEASADATTRLTRHGFIAAGPRFDRVDGNSIVYAARTPHGFPALNRVSRDGSTVTRIATRYLGSTAAIGADAIYFDQQEIRRNVGVYSDLYALSRADHRVRRMSSEARLLDPDLSPDGTTLVCTQQKPGRRELVLVRLKPDATPNVRLKPDPTPDVRLKPDSTTDARPKPGTRRSADVASGFSRTPAITALISEPDTQFDAPRWSPDGRTIAVERHRPGSLSEVVLVDVDSKTVRPIDGPERARMVTPTWRPDGRAVLVSVAAEDQPFNLVEFSVDGQALPRRLTHTTGGATWPDVSADGRTIVFVGYTVDGFDLFTMAYPSPGPESLASSVRPGPPKNERVAPVVSPPQSNRPTSSYSPLRTLWPTSWVPILEDDQSQDRVGARVFGSDVLGYHVYSADATWLTARPSDSLSPRSTFDWSAYYAYARWRPVFWVSAEKSTSFFAGQPDERGEPLPVTLHERQVETGVSFPMIHTRIAQRSQVSFVRAVDHYTMPDGSTSLDRAALRGAWSMGTAHTYGYSISPERGVVVGTTAEAVRTALGSDANATMLTTDLRLFAPMPASHHVLAVRAAAGTATGDPNIRRTFHLGGAGPDASVMSFNRDALSVLRGFPADRFAGSHVALLNVDYRFPIVRPQRGADTWPLFLHTVHAAAFADVGHAWTSNFRGRDMKTSIGGELSVDIVFGYFVPLTVSAGAARGHDGRGLERDRTTLYLRIGRAF